MTRQSISFSEPNNAWLKSLIESKEYSTKSEAVNALIRKERERQAELSFLRAKLKASEESGLEIISKENFKKEIKGLAKKNGLI